MVFCDTHAHLYAEEFDGDRDAMIQRALDAGVKYLFLPDIDSAFTKPMLDLVSRYPEHCFPMTGLHPTSVKENFRDELKIIESNLEDLTMKFYAIGEIGIDLYWDKTYSAEQEKAFRRQVELSIKHNLPVVIHTRNSFDVTSSILEDYRGKARGIFHCFSGNVLQAKTAVDLGYLLGIGGIITFKNSGLKEVVESIPLENLVLETDAPYLAPVPYRGKRNESSYIPVIAAKVAELKNTDLEKVAEVTTRNALLLFTA